MDWVIVIVGVVQLLFGIGLGYLLWGQQPDPCPFPGECIPCSTDEKTRGAVTHFYYRADVSSGPFVTLVGG